MLFLLQTEPLVLISVVGLLGLLLGSFLNVVIHRLPKMMEREWQQQCDDYLQWQAEQRGEQPAEDAPSATRYNLIVPASACPACGHKIRAWENIPVISYLLLRGRCSGCKTAISMRYPLVELSSGLLSAAAAWYFGYGVILLGALVLIWSLLALTMIDFDTQLLPDDITLPLIWLGLLFNLWGGFTSLSSAVIGAIIGYMALWSLFWAFKLLTGKEGMGYGDFKLLAALGAWMGWTMLPLIILLSSVVGAVVGIALMVFAGHGRSKPIPFGPYLAGGGLIALFWGQQLTQNYLQLMAV